MFWVLVTMLFILTMAASVALFVAFPRRGAAVPHAGWVGDALERGVRSLPTLDNQRDPQHHHPNQRQHDRVS